jgi:hypothetical protein
MFHARAEEFWRDAPVATQRELIETFVERVDLAPVPEGHKYFTSATITWREYWQPYAPPLPPILSRRPQIGPRKASTTAHHHAALAKLTQEQADAIRAEYAEKRTPYKDLGARYGVSIATISKVVLGRAWKPKV